MNEEKLMEELGLLGWEVKCLEGGRKDEMYVTFGVDWWWKNGCALNVVVEMNKCHLWVNLR